MSESSTGQRSGQVLSTGGRTHRSPVGTVRTGMRRTGFTLVELLVVIGIIVILIGLLIPAVGYVRTASRVASTQSLLVQMQGAIEQYYQDFRAYPGPLPNDAMYVPGGGVAGVTGRVTMSENLTLGLLGGLYNAGGVITYDPTRVGRGPVTLAGVGVSAGRVKSPYLAATADLTTTSPNSDPAAPGHFHDLVAEANDSIIPEFVDRFTSPMPILYLRARAGAPTTFNMGGGVCTVITDANNVRGSGAIGTAGGAQYDISQIFGYVGSFNGSWAAGTMARAALDGNEIPHDGACIGEGKSCKYWYGPLDESDPRAPFDIADVFAQRGTMPHHGLMNMALYPAGTVGDNRVYVPITAPGYFRNPAFGGAAAFTNQDQPRGKDGYLLISPGPDRVYGTPDDITSFGSVMP